MSRVARSWIVLATLLSRVARHDPEALARFAAEVGALRALGKKAACWRDLAAIEKERLQVGMVAPDIEGKDLDGKPFKLSDYRGKVVVLDFWGDW